MKAFVLHLGQAHSRKHALPKDNRRHASPTGHYAEGGELLDVVSRGFGKGESGGFQFGGSMFYSQGMYIRPAVADVLNRRMINYPELKIILLWVVIARVMCNLGENPNAVRPSAESHGRSEL